MEVQLHAARDRTASDTLPIDKIPSTVWIESCLDPREVTDSLQNRILCSRWERLDVQSEVTTPTELPWLLHFSHS
jgi:hypothetical protein